MGQLIEVSPDQEQAELTCMLSRASHAMTMELASALDEVGISQRSHSVLNAALQGEYSQIELARIVGLDKTTMVVTLDELEAAGLAERRQSKVDRRARVIAVTPAGKQLVKRGEKIAAEVREEVLCALNDDEREIFMSALAKLVSGPLSEPSVCSQSVRRRNAPI
ncbi:MAG: MarR family winged helix-turn-helix transcriptional regulator [Solirubrobacterales bacterium]